MLRTLSRLTFTSLAITRTNPGCIQVIDYPMAEVIERVTVTIGVPSTARLVDRDALYALSIPEKSLLRD